MKKILVIDNTFDPPHGSPEICRLLQEGAVEFGGAEIVAVRGPESQIPENLEQFSGAVLSGSKTRIYENAPWIDLEIEAIKKLHELKIPTLGICYGEQLIARALGGEEYTGAAKQSEHGWQEIEMKEKSAILEGLPNKFHSFEFHSDEVYKLPKGFKVTASSGACQVQAFDVEGAPMWGIQFHPERDLEAGNRGLDRRLANVPGSVVINRDKAEKIYDPIVGKTIFRNFLRHIWPGR